MRTALIMVDRGLFIVSVRLAASRSCWVWVTL